MNIYWRLGLITFISCLAAEILSYLGYFTPWVQWVTGALVVLTALVLSFKDLKYGLYIIAAELIIGSQGYLFSINGAGSGFSLRIALWIVVMAVWLLQSLGRFRQDPAAFRQRYLSAYWRPLTLLAAGVILGISVGLLAHNDLTYMFLDGKRWMFALLLLPFLDSFRRREDLHELLSVSITAAFWLGLKTLLLVYIFSHTFIPLVYDVYAWMRFALLGEITRLPSGFTRVFMQSQIYLIPLFFGASLWLGAKAHIFKNQPKCAWVISSLAVVGAAALTACLSRSFWVGMAAAVVLWIAIQLILIRTNWKQFFRSLSIMIGLGILGIGLVFAVVRFPYPKPSVLIDGSLLSDRATQFEAGAASRWSLLPVLGKEMMQSPLWGKGFGATVTYVTSDPRITLSTTDGKYTTYAFEWGWLDLWLKTGLLGVIGYVWLFWLMLRDAYILMRRQDPRGTIIGMSIIALAVIHFFTPYLNHPLGFGYLIIALLVLRQSREGEIAAT